MPRDRRPALTKNTTPVAANDDAVDLLDHIDPRSPGFLSEATAVAAYLVDGQGRWQDSCRRIVTTALMNRTLQAAHERRPCFLTEIEAVLEEAGRRIRRHSNSQAIVDRTTNSCLADGVPS